MRCRYAVTYVNSYGEGSESDWVKVDVNREQQVQVSSSQTLG